MCLHTLLIEYLLNIKGLLCARIIKHNCFWLACCNPLIPLYPDVSDVLSVCQQQVRTTRDFPSLAKYHVHDQSSQITIFVSSITIQKLPQSILLLHTKQ